MERELLRVGANFPSKEILDEACEVEK